MNRQYLQTVQEAANQSAAMQHALMTELMDKMSPSISDYCKWIMVIGLGVTFGLTLFHGGKWLIDQSILSWIEQQKR